MRQRISSKLKQSRDQLTPDHVWVSTNREALMRIVQTDMAEVVSSQATKPSAINGLFAQLMPEKFATVARSAMALLLAITVTTGGWIATVAASAESLPGEKLHTVKLATEGVELAVSKVLGSDKDEVSTKLKHATVRAKEYQKASNPEQKQQAIQALKKTIESSNETLAEIEQSSPNNAVAVAKVVGTKTEEILTELGNAKKEQKETDAQISLAVKEDAIGKTKALNAEVAKVEELIEEASSKAITVLLEESTKKESKVTPEEVKVVVEKKVARLTSELTEIKEELKGAVEQVSVNTTEQKQVNELTVSVNAALATVSSTTNTSAVHSTVTASVGASTTVVTTPATFSATTSTGEPVPSPKITTDPEAVVTNIEVLIKQKDVAGILALFESLTQQKKQALYNVTEIKEALNALLDKTSQENINASTTQSTQQKNDGTTGVLSAPKPVVEKPTTQP